MLVSDHPHLFETGGENYHTDFHGWEYLRGGESDPFPNKRQCPLRDDPHAASIHIPKRDVQKASPARPCDSPPRCIEDRGLSRGASYPHRHHPRSRARRTRPYYRQLEESTRATCTSRRRPDPLEYRRPITGRPQSRTIRGVMAFGSSQADASRAAATMPFYIENLTLV